MIKSPIFGLTDNYQLMNLRFINKSNFTQLFKWMPGSVLQTC